MSLTPGDDARFWLYIFPPFRVLEFIAGCLLALLIRSGWRSPVRLPVAALSAAVAYALLTAGNREGHALGNGVEDAVILPFMLLVIASAATADISGKGRLLSHPRVVRLGEWSFALYLTHWLLLELVVHLNPGSNARSGPLQLMEGGVIVLVAVAVSRAAFTWFEKPLKKRLRGRRPRPEMVAAEENGVAAC
jgi:peptidoglycan/LPS O-acetylase OafA/YrhL